MRSSTRRARLRHDRHRSRDDRKIHREEAEGDSCSDDLDHEHREGTRLLSADTRTVGMSIISFRLST